MPAVQQQEEVGSAPGKALPANGVSSGRKDYLLDHLECALLLARQRRLDLVTCIIKAAIMAMRTPSLAR